MITILLNVWASQKHMTTAEVAKEMQLVHRAMHIVRSMEPWYVQPTIHTEDDRADSYSYS